MNKKIIVCLVLSVLLVNFSSVDSMVPIVDSVTQYGSSHNYSTPTIIPDLVKILQVTFTVKGDLYTVLEGYNELWAHFAIFTYSADNYLYSSFISYMSHAELVQVTYYNSSYSYMQNYIVVNAWFDEATFRESFEFDHTKLYLVYITGYDVNNQKINEGYTSCQTAHIFLSSEPAVTPAPIAKNNLYLLLGIPGAFIVLILVVYFVRRKK